MSHGIMAMRQWVTPSEIGAILTSEPLPFRQWPAVDHPAATFLAHQDPQVWANRQSHRVHRLHEFRGRCERVGGEA